MTDSGSNFHFRYKDLLLFIPALMAFGLQRILAGFPEFTEVWFTGRFFRWMSYPVSWVSSLVPFSLTEALIWSVLPMLIIILLSIWLKARNVRKNVANRSMQMERDELANNRTELEIFSSTSEQTSKKGNHQQGVAFGNKPGLSATHFTNTKPSQVWSRALVATGWTASWAYLVFMLLFGFNYARMPAAEIFGIDVHDRSADELAKLTFFLARQTAEAREHIQEDEQGVMQLRNNIPRTLATGYEGFQLASQQWPELRIPKRRAKGVMASRWWSYTRISGMYFPFFVEANVNIAMPHSSIPSTTMHELAHTIGFAREDEAEFVAFLAGTAHSNPDFVYSAWLNAFVYASNALGRVDREAWFEAAQLAGPGVARDLTARMVFWQQFEGPIAEASVRINDAYLRSNMQVEGVRSYGAVVDLLLAYFAE